MKVLITSHVKVFLANKYNSYINTVRNEKALLLVYEKTVMKWKKKGFRGLFRTHSNMYEEAF